MSTVTRVVGAVASREGLEDGPEDGRARGCKGWTGMMWGRRRSRGEPQVKTSRVRVECMPRIILR